MKEELLGPKEVAELLGVPVGYIYKLTSKKPPGIPHYKVGKYIKFSPSGVAAWLAQKEIGPKPTNMSDFRVSANPE